MAATSHNLSRRALLGAGAAACAFAAAAPSSPFGLSLSKPVPSSPLEGENALRQPQGEREVRARNALHSRWHRALAACRQAEARVAAFKAEEALLPAAQRTFPACEALEERFGRLDDLRLAALRRLLGLAAPDLTALSLKFDLAIADQAWELDGCETCLVTLQTDARRLAYGG